MRSTVSWTYHTRHRCRPFRGQPWLDDVLRHRVVLQHCMLPGWMASQLALEPRWRPGLGHMHCRRHDARLSISILHCLGGKVGGASNWSSAWVPEATMSQVPELVQSAKHVQSRPTCSKSLKICAICSKSPSPRSARFGRHRPRLGGIRPKFCRVGRRTPLPEVDVTTAVAYLALSVLFAEKASDQCTNSSEQAECGHLRGASSGVHGQNGPGGRPKLGRNEGAAFGRMPSSAMRCSRQRRWRQRALRRRRERYARRRCRRRRRM